MEKINVMGRLFYVIALIGVAIQQLYYQDFCPMLFPEWPNPIRGYALSACLFSAALIAACILIVSSKNARAAALLTGSILLLMLFFGQVLYEFLIIPYKKTHLGLWILPLKELALAGGAFCIAGSLPDSNIPKNLLIRSLEKLIFLGPAFFSTTIICFGISHFLYTPTVADMIPKWIPAHNFWTYFTAVALIAAGAAIVINVLKQLAAFLLGAMILVWFVFLHVPGAIRYPLLDKGNLVFSALSALAFSGIAWVIAGSAGIRKTTAIELNTYKIFGKLTLNK